MRRWSGFEPRVVERVWQFVDLKFRSKVMVCQKVRSALAKDANFGLSCLCEWWRVGCATYFLKGLAECGVGPKPAFQTSIARARQRGKRRP